MTATFHIIVPFVYSDDGVLWPGEALQAADADTSINIARDLSQTHAGVLAFSRTGNPAAGRYGDPVLLARFGHVEMDALRR
ncbi:MAG: hypothetical protein JO366_02580 [Methylobacteriaceae bacterium]|nr:hypothetical protein [Methylobacteriaceae bacterium]MBV9220968.1 hypothetical protein [Methylobacteriaceae bacterium]MBV9243677.1 hypothetical protein [Methylobacteriaceae bacterium]MBV9637874.1 hypothetical protein [Methylobacteriaceae bacterium]MBV9704476.1 hypothetical protein [Methylobacteriaceae bacterium]